MTLTFEILWTVLCTRYWYQCNLYVPNWYFTGYYTVLPWFTGPVRFHVIRKISRCRPVLQRPVLQILFDWLIDWLTDWLFDGLIDWFIHPSIHHHPCPHPHSPFIYSFIHSVSHLPVNTNKIKMKMGNYAQNLKEIYEFPDLKLECLKRFSRYRLEIKTSILLFQRAFQWYQTHTSFTPTALYRKWISPAAQIWRNLSAKSLARFDFLSLRANWRSPSANTGIGHSEWVARSSHIIWTTSGMTCLNLTLRKISGLEDPCARLMQLLDIVSVMSFDLLMILSRRYVELWGGITVKLCGVWAIVQLLARHSLLWSLLM